MATVIERILDERAALIAAGRPLPRAVELGLAEMTEVRGMMGQHVQEEHGWGTPLPPVDEWQVFGLNIYPVEADSALRLVDRRRVAV